MTIIKYKEKWKKYHRKYMKKWRQNRPKDNLKSLIRKRKYKKNYPWCTYRSNAKKRCAPSGVYYKRGIKCLLTIEEVKQLWYRDKAYLMTNPSLDRIAGNNSNYTFQNCRFIELRNNVSRNGIVIEICPHCGKNIYST